LVMRELRRLYEQETKARQRLQHLKPVSSAWRGTEQGSGAAKTSTRLRVVAGDHDNENQKRKRKPFGGEASSKIRRQPACMRFAVNRRRSVRGCNLGNENPNEEEDTETTSMKKANYSDLSDGIKIGK
jgi:hypothetical protein